MSPIAIAAILAVVIIMLGVVAFYCYNSYTKIKDVKDLESEYSYLMWSFYVAILAIFFILVTIGLTYYSHEISTMGLGFSILITIALTILTAVVASRLGSNPSYSTGTKTKEAYDNTLIAAVIAGVSVLVLIGLYLFNRRSHPVY